MKRLILQLLFLINIVVVTHASASVIEDFENKISVESGKGWGFYQVKFSAASNFGISGNYSGAMTEVNGSDPIAWIKTPWLVVQSGSISFRIKYDKNGSRDYKLYAIPNEPTASGREGVSVLINSKTFQTSAKNTIEMINVAIPNSYIGKYYKFLFVYSGMTNGAKTSVDDFSIPGDVMKDADGDGVADIEDQYPNDPFRAYNNYFPSQTTYGTLAFEDSWPVMGDYDFNDVVVGYNVNRVTNSCNEVVEVKARFVLRASGANRKNGFGFQLDGISPNKVASVSGCRRSAGTYIKDASNGLEQNQSFASCIVFDNFFNEMGYPGVGTGINTEEDAPFVPNDTIDVKLTCIQNGQAPAGGKMKLDDLSMDLFNYFIIANQQRGVEIHLPKHNPTDLVNRSLFRSGDDASSGNVYYRTTKNLPWGLNIIQPFDYPVEKDAINEGYTHFVDWAVSAGANYTDWYKSNNGYRNADKIYKKK